MIKHLTDEDNERCNNIFCLHNSNKDLADWNKTNCGMYEIDPIAPDNPAGFKISECPARLRYVKMGWD